MSILTITIIFLFIHWFADFVIQTHKEAKEKSKSWKALLSHTATYSGIWFVALLVLQLPVIPVIIFTAVTFIAHTVTDYITSRETNKLYEKGDIHNFFVIIGLDQLLHYIQIFVAYTLIF